jgi:hypothetical protein
MRLKQYSMRTEEAYEEWVCRFVLFQRKRDPRMEQAKSVPELTLSSQKVVAVYSKSGEERASFSL